MISPAAPVPGEGGHLVPGRIERRPGVRVPHAVPGDDQGLAGAVEERLPVPLRATRPVHRRRHERRATTPNCATRSSTRRRCCRRSGMAVITDVGDEKDIHPHAEGAGRRAAGAGCPGAGLRREDRLQRPGVTRTLKFEGDTATAVFDHVGGGLVAKDGDLTGFTACRRGQQVPSGEGGDQGRHGRRDLRQGARSRWRCGTGG